MFYPLHYDSVNLKSVCIFITYRYTDLVMNSINDICSYEANIVYDLCVTFVFTNKKCRLNLFGLSLMIRRTIIVFPLLSTAMLWKQRNAQPFIIYSIAAIIIKVHSNYLAGKQCVVVQNGDNYIFGVTQDMGKTFSSILSVNAW